MGTHGIPASYGGFETAAERIAYYLRDRGWRVIVYCQEEGEGPLREDDWNGIHRVIIPVKRTGWLGTATFDLISIRDATLHKEICLTLGYNTAIFNMLQRVKGIPNVINMDGIEWSRARWGFFRQSILWVNERIACWVGNELIADHPEVHKHLLRRAKPHKITTINYGADAIFDASVQPVTSRGLSPGAYLTLICRPIPENSIHELVEGFSRRHRGVKLAVLGNYDPSDEYQSRVLSVASEEVVFLGAVYGDDVSALRVHSLGYLHGHTLGGTNPSLVEAMGAGNPIVAHDNKFNRWTARDAALYFRNVDDVDKRITQLLADKDLRTSLSVASRKRHAEEFTWDYIGGKYETLLLKAVSTSPCK